jgi:hypothetical protein
MVPEDRLVKALTTEAFDDKDFFFPKRGFHRIFRLTFPFFITTAPRGKPKSSC